MGKYRSRRKQLKRNKPKGGAVKPTVPKQADVHTSAHHPEDLIRVMQAQPDPTVEDHAMELLHSHAKVAKAEKHPIARFKRYVARRADHSIDLHSMAKTIYRKYSHQPIPKTRGGAITKQQAVDGAISVASKVADPITEANRARGQYDQIDMGDWSGHGMVSNARHAYSGNFHAASAHMKAANIASLGVFSAPLLGAAAGFSAVGSGIGF